MKILHTGDLHLGRNYASYAHVDSGIAARYRDARMEALKNVIKTAHNEKCGCIVVAGDLFDKKTQVPMSLHKEVCGILSDFDGTVFVLPGNHDFYVDEKDELWRNFRKSCAGNTVLLCENRPYETEDAVFYPCVCHDRHSGGNALGWLDENTERSAEKLNIGIAHGAIEGLSYDREQRYYFMTKQELERCNMDLWLIGHTHVPYPDGDGILDGRIFNAGTHQQTDVSDHSEGSVFVVDIEKDRVKARRIHTGVISFLEKQIHLSHGESLEEQVRLAAKGLDQENTALRLSLSGIALAEEFEKRAEIYADAEKDFLNLEIFDDALQPEITADMVNSETLEGSMENRLLHLYMDEPETLNLAFQLIKKCKGEGR